MVTHETPRSRRLYSAFGALIAGVVLFAGPAGVAVAAPGGSQGNNGGNGNHGQGNNGQGNGGGNTGGGGGNTGTYEVRAGRSAPSRAWLLHAYPATAPGRLRRPGDR